MYNNEPKVSPATLTQIQKWRKKIDLHWPGIEPGPPAWQARILPLNHQYLAISIDNLF